MLVFHLINPFLYLLSQWHIYYCSGISTGTANIYLWQFLANIQVKQIPFYELLSLFPIRWQKLPVAQWLLGNKWYCKWNKSRYVYLDLTWLLILQFQWMLYIFLLFYTCDFGLNKQTNKQIPPNLHLSTSLLKLYSRLFCYICFIFFFIYTITVIL